jgi:hypothetical protein
VTQEIIAGGFFVLVGVAMVVFRTQLTSYLYAMYPASVRPDREILRWMVLIGGVLVVLIGGSVLIGLR